MNVLSLREQVKRGSMAVKALRANRLKSGLPFMINVTGMERKLCYMEYPNGKIHLVKQSNNGSDFETMHILDESETIQLRNRFDLY
ncbi:MULTISPECIES: hypothetical protein [Sphingobacterium]|uniref:Uncharacterized protein n=2 Tax=Sphingobacterium TaxID=28453 RepID=A0A4U0H9C7_9SPHI|nr:MULTISPECIES: hypothetical protein [Sphingobacterium]MBE8721905.1 hypothetical protein [Sphingobacterium pedocola]TJY68386.1 hypothetical protein FAZ19_03785 [Sphingobacterium alkalisoli]GGH06846.1 hypothetical protein GCM10011418_03750 [Sphingobacterium alkalisoli]